jgi:predicted TIM-barrel fold metal-dependent hydrolase
MFKTERAISADSHVNEPPDLWEKRLPADLRDRGPRCVELENGGQGWTMEGAAAPVALGFTAVNFRASKRFERGNYRQKFAEYRDGEKRGVRFEEILPGSFDAKARLLEQDEDGVYAEVLYDSPPLWPGIKSFGDRRLKLACFRAYNDWMAEFCSVAPERLIGVGLIPTTGVEDAKAEMIRCVDELKLRTVALESYPSGHPSEPTAGDDQFWALAEEMGVPVSVHASFTLPSDASMLFSSGQLQKIIDLAEVGSFQQVLEKLIMSGLFDRFPDMRFVGVEVGAGWIPFYLDRFDASYRKYRGTSACQLDRLPSEYFEKNVKVTFILDQYGVNNRYRIGVDNMMWSSDFPHSVSNWPIDTELGLAQLERAAVPPAEAERLMWRTCAELYGLEVGLS